MKLLNSLFTASFQGNTADGATYAVHLDRDHFIYGAHFPGEPITPGVCIMQMTLEMLELYVGQALELDTVKNVKFLQIIDPRECPELFCEFSGISNREGVVTARARLYTGETILSKLSLVCRVA